MHVLKEKIKRQIHQALEINLFSGAAVGFCRINQKGKISRKLIYGGYTEKNDQKNPVSSEILFDLASLTKPIVTVSSILHLLYSGLIDWQDNIESLLSTPVSKEKKKITLEKLLSHCSGLPAHRPYYDIFNKKKEGGVKEKITQHILTDKLIATPGLKTEYSDLGYILLGNIIEKKTETSLDEMWKRKIAPGYSLEDKIIFLKNREIGPEKCVATAVNVKTGKSVCGIVNDDNCRIMGGVAGHAGLFGTLDGVLLFCEKVIKQYTEQETSSLYSYDILQKALKKGASTWTCGYDTPSSSGSVTGKYFSKSSFGHLGFTGTSFWMDMAKRVAVVILTNRVLMETSKDEINDFRKTIHNSVMGGLFSV